ncbi:MAG: DUF4416 family protein [Candidatus Krumholzibacteria bacterium]|nr:DUF4416 family protein [Candidatus Krumholzibacteria bacterium]
MAHEKAGRPVEAEPVKYLAAILLEQDFDAEEELFSALEGLLGRIDYRGTAHQFDVSDYYEDEMGPSLKRLLVSFEPLESPTKLVRIKLDTTVIEEQFSADSGRSVNIDPGYMDYHKVVLASFKQGPQKIYLDDGVYADPVMLFQHGDFMPLPWTFPDFKAGYYAGDLTAIRKIYKEARRAEKP